MSNVKTKHESGTDLSYSKSVVLTTLTKVQSSSSISSLCCNNDHNDLLQHCFDKNKEKNNLIHICNNWLWENYNYYSHYPTDVIRDYSEQHKNIRRKENKSKILVLKKKLNYIKNKIINIKTKQNKYFDKQQINKCNFLTKRLLNTNKSCCISNTIENEMENEDKNKLKHISKTFSQNDEIDLSTDDMISSIDKHDEIDKHIENDKHIDNNKYNDIEKTNVNYKEKSPPDEYIKRSIKITLPDGEITTNVINNTNLPDLSVKENSVGNIKMEKEKERLYESQLLHKFVEIISEKYSSKDMIPDGYNLCYTFYIYIYPSQTDGNLLLFRRHELKSLCRLLEPFDVMKLIEDTKADFLFDRRLKMVQNQCNCHILLQPLNNIRINGLPHRLINIYSSNYENIAKALCMMEEVMPEIMQTSVFKNTLPTNYSRKWPQNEIIIRPIKKPIRDDNRNQTWFNRIDPDLRFSSYNYVLNPLNQTDHSVKSLNRMIHKSVPNNTKNDNSITKSKSLQNTEITNISIKSNRTFIKNSNINNEKTKKNLNDSNNIKFRHVKRIKCPASILKKDLFSDRCALNFLFDKFNCKIIGIDKVDGINKGKSSEEEQIKLTIVYNIKTQFSEFCNALKLKIKLKKKKEK